MSELKFYRGLAEKYVSEIHGDGIYFATNTRQIIHAGVAYGVASEIDLSNYATKDFVSDILCGYVRDLVYDEVTGEFTYFRKKKIYDFDGSYTYSDEPIKFSLRSNFRGLVKDLDFKISETGAGYITYKKLVEELDELETGEEITRLIEQEVSVEIPEASYKKNGETEVFSNGLMSGKHIKTLNTLEKDLKEHSTWTEVTSPVEN